MSSKEIISILARMDVQVTNHMSVMDNDMVSKVEQFMNNLKGKSSGERSNQGNMEQNKTGKTNDKSLQSNTANANAGKEKDYDTLVDDRVSSQPRDVRIPKKPGTAKQGSPKSGTSGGNKPQGNAQGGNRGGQNRGGNNNRGWNNNNNRGGNNISVS